MSSETELPHGIHYVTRDGITYHLDRYMAEQGRTRAAAIPSPERDVLAALLRFCLEGCEVWNFNDQYPHLIATPLRVDGQVTNP